MRPIINPVAPSAAERRIRELVIRRRVERQAEFFRHLLFYLVVCTLLWAINLWQIRDIGFMRTERWWAFIVTAAWGIGVFTHGLSVAMSRLPKVPFLSLDWEEKKVRELMKHEEEVNVR
ncbi:MAG: hypothetical protein EAZ21_10505 [Betaproteobacteria bacterium]|nr:MAG: hypothetical protein EAZ21_10505 [Betaproteobacteria bacterium]